MREEWKALKVSFALLVVLAPLIFIMVFIARLGIGHNEITEYLSDYDQNDSMIVVHYGVITSKTGVRECDFLFATKDSVYISRDGKSSTEIKRVDHSGENEELIYTFDGKAKRIAMPNEKIAFIHSIDDRYYRYDISEESLVTITEEEMPAEDEVNAEYSYELTSKINGRGVGYESATLIRKADGEERVVTLDEIIEVLQDFETLEEAYEPKIGIDYVFFENGKIYIGCLLYGNSLGQYIMVFEYDFDSNNISYFGWREIVEIRHLLGIFVIPDTKEE